VHKSVTFNRRIERCKNDAFSILPKFKWRVKKTLRKTNLNPLNPVNQLSPLGTVALKILAKKYALMAQQERTAHAEFWVAELRSSHSLPTLGVYSILYIYSNGPKKFPPHLGGGQQPKWRAQWRRRRRPTSLRPSRAEPIWGWAKLLEANSAKKRRKSERRPTSHGGQPLKEVSLRFAGDWAPG